MKFSDKEKDDAQPVTQNFYAENIGFVGNAYDSAKIINNQPAQKMDFAIIQEIIDQIKDNSEQLPLEIKQEVVDQTKKLESEVSEKKEKETINALRSIRTICETASGSVIAQGIISLINKLPF